MKAIESRLYMNVILTVIAILLAAHVLRPYFSFSTPAFAQQRERIEELEGAQYRDLAVSTLAVAEATNDIAAAIREAAKSQGDIAKAITKLNQQ